MGLTCTRRECADKDLTDPRSHGIDPGTGLETCRGCGSFLMERDRITTAIDTDRRARGEQPPWEGSWAKDGGGWAIRLWMPDNDHREEEPQEGDPVRITTRSGKVQVVKLGRLLDTNRKSMTFAAPARK